MPILINNRQKLTKIDLGKTRKKAKRLLGALGQSRAELSILFTDDEEITALNEQYLHRSGPTNVLSFPIHPQDSPGAGARVLGDIAISVETAGKEAELEGISFEARLDWLLVHGLLHLLDYDHVTPEDAARMFRKEEEMLELIKSNA